MVTLRVDIKTDSKFLLLDQGPGLDRITAGSIMELIQMGESRLDEVLRPRPAGVYLSIGEAQRGHASTGFFRRSVHARHSSRSGTIESNVVYGPWLERVSARNALTRFKGYQSFRKTGQWLEKQADRVINRRINAYIRSVS